MVKMYAERGNHTEREKTCPMPDILLIQPPIRDFYLTEKRTIPYGLSCIAAELVRQGFSVEVLDALATSNRKTIDLPGEMAYLKGFYGVHDVSPFALFHHYRHFGYSFQFLGERAGRSGAFLVGVSSLFTPYSGEALQTAEAVRKHLPRCKIVLGGHHPTAMPESVMECGAVDYVIRGEGEAAMPALAKALREGSDVSNVPGIVFRKPGGGLHISPPAVLKGLDRYAPGGCFHNRDYYMRAGRLSVAVVAGRGCPLHCTYCSVGASAHAGYRQRSVQSVLAEIDDAVASASSHKVGFIDFEDENISLDRQWFLNLLEGLARRYAGSDSGPEVRAMNGLLPATLDRKIIHAMKRAGFKVLNLSLGSTLPEQLRCFRRPNVNAAFDDALRHAEKYGMQAVGYVIAGAPGQTPLGSVSDLLFLARRRVLAGVSIYYPSPGSEDFLRCGERAILPQSLSLMRSSAIPISDTTTRVESVTLLRLGRILNFMKSLIDSGAGLPDPEPEPARTERPDPLRRVETGRILLGWFLHDAIIRGITPEGETFRHDCSPDLCKAFVEGLKGLTVRGVVS